MRRIMILIMLASALTLTACGNTDESNDKRSTNSENSKEEQNAQADKSEDADSKTDASEEQGDPEGDIKIHVLKADEEAGATVENHPAYSAVADFAKQHPDFGEKGDYFVAVVDATKPKDGKADLLLIGVNRLEEPVGKVTFRISIGDKKGHTVLDNRLVEIPADAMGKLQPGYGHPILVPITEEELDNLNNLDADTQFVDMEDTKVSRAK